MYQIPTFDMKLDDIFSTFRKFVDVSDPDITPPLSWYSNRRSCKKRWSDWLQLIGLIHDIANNVFKGCDEDGTSPKNSGNSRRYFYSSCKYLIL